MHYKANLIWLGAVPALALAGCTTNEQVAGTAGAPTVAAQAGAVPGGTVHWGSTTTSMASQYTGPHPGAVPAAGASAWVPPAPAPAYVDTRPLPPVAQPGPPPGTAARRPPSTPAPAPVDAASLQRPEAAAPEAAAPSATVSSATLAAGRKLFNDYSCGQCHALADANAQGSIGPAFDRNTGLSKPFIVATLTSGRGAMPSFAGQLSDAEMATLADYILGVHK